MVQKPLSKQMPDTWSIFFKKRKPRPLQKQSMPLLIHGESVLLSGPTASGKTEAAITPLLQRHISFKRKQVSVVYIAPTKALVNDIYHRLDSYLCARMPNSIRRYTGDHHDFNDPEGLFLLITTPEALDSLQLTRWESLAGIRAIVVDEIHMLHGNARGQQLRHVISRIEKNAAKPKQPKDIFQKIGMTATIQDMENVSNIWLGENAKIIKAGNPRDIDITYLPVSIPDGSEKSAEAANIIASWLEETGTPKGLIFGNTRNNTQVLAANLYEKLKDSRWPVHWHTGIITASERERVEEAMKNDRFGVCVATATLEVGIDIGDLDIIILADPPYSINAFLQRIGRGNRKTDICKVIALYATEQELMLFHALHHCASKGTLDEIHEYDRAAVRFQQIVSFAWHGANHDRPLTKKNLPARTCDSGHGPVVEDMLETGSLENIQGALVLSRELTDQGERRQIHTTITGARTFNMVDSSSGETIISASGQGVTQGALFVGGKIKNVTSNVDGTISLESTRGKRLPLSSLPATRGKRGLGRRIIWALAEMAGQDPFSWEYEGSRIITWGGADYNRLLAIILEMEGITSNAKPDEYGISGIPDGAEILPSQILEWANLIQQSENLPTREISHFCDRSRYFSNLSSEMQAEEAFRSVPFDGFFNWLQECNTLPEDKVSTVSETEIQRQKKNQVDNSENGVTLLINWSEDNQTHPGIRYARAVTSHFYSAAGRVSGKTTNTPLIEDLDLQDCAFLLREKSEIILTFHKSDKDDCLAEDWTLRVNGETDNQVKINISNIQSPAGSIDFSHFKNFQWLQAEQDLTSPIGVLALIRNQSKLHYQAFHSLVGLARSFGEPKKAELTAVQNKPKPIITWRSDPQGSDIQEMIPVYSHCNGSLWLPGLYEKDQNDPILWFSVHDEAESVEKPWLERSFWTEKLRGFCQQEVKDLSALSQFLNENLPIDFQVEIISLDEISDIPLMVPRQQGTLFLLAPGDDRMLIGLDFDQAPEILEKTLLHAIAHLLCGHVLPGDEYGHADTVDTVIGQGHLNRWDREAYQLFPLPEKSSLNDCTPEEKAMLGLWQMIGDMIGRNLILHRKAEQYQKAAYQRQAAQRLLTQLEEYGGSMLCDGVGLGKTYVTTTLLVHYANVWLENRQSNDYSTSDDQFRITVLAPNSVVSTWQREALPSLVKFGVSLPMVRVISHTKLSRVTPTSDVLAARPGGQVSDLEHLLLSDLVVVDEAHIFRSVSARRTLVLRDLLRLQPRKDHRRLVLLLTATPINNSLEDLQQETALLFSRPLWLSDAQTVDGYRRQAVKEVSERCRKARTAKTGGGDIAALVVHGRPEARFSAANDFRDDLDFGPNVQRIGDYLKEQDKKLKKYQDEIKTASILGNHAGIEGKAIRIADDLLDRVVVQRSRALCKEIEMQQGSDIELLFRRDAELPEKLNYADEYDGIEDVLANFLPLFETNEEIVHENGLRPLSLKVYMWYDVKEGIKTADEVSSVVGLQRILVLKRLESSPVSFLVTLLRLMVLHTHRLHQLLNLCQKTGAYQRYDELKNAIDRILYSKQDVLSKITSLTTGAGANVNKEKFVKILSKAYSSSRPAADADDHEPFQLSLFPSFDGADAKFEKEQLDRLWDLGSTLIDDFQTLLNVTPALADIVFGKFSQSEWPRRFIAGGENVDWPTSVDWGLRVVTDPKIRKLVGRLMTVRIKKQKAIVFSQFSDTLAYIHSVLKACVNFTRKEWDITVAALGIEQITEQEIKELLAGIRVITGDTEDRDTIVNSFAPFYRIGPVPPNGGETNPLAGDTSVDEWKTSWSRAIQEPVDVLLSTDVLAEGVNLQDVSVLVNFDIHWNPVRMIQRSGRIDRRLNPAIEQVGSFKDVKKLAQKLGKPTPTYYWHDKQDEAPVTVNMILPDEIEKELLLRERIAVKTLAIDFTLGLERGTGAEAQWMENYKYQGISSLNAFQKDRAIEKVASYYDRLNILFREQGINTTWTEKLNGWFREENGTVSSPFAGRVKIGKRGSEQQVYSRYLEPAMKNGVPYWLWSQEKPGESLLNFWIGLDAKTFPPIIAKDLGWHENASQPLSAEQLLHAVIRLVDGDINIKELSPQEVGKPLMQGVTVIAAGYLGSEDDRRLISIGKFFLLQLNHFLPERKTD